MSGESWRRRVRALLARAGHKNADPERFATAFVHESAVREGLADRSNERLEFVGDAVLGLVAARWLYQTYPDADEGELALRKSALVSDAALAESAERLGFAELTLLGTGLARLPEARRRSTLGDAFEAFCAALFQVAGLEAVERFIVREHIGPRLETMQSLGDPKSLRPEWSQKHYAAPPTYTERSERPPHERVFHATVAVQSEIVGEGSGASKKLAHRAAAAVALDKLRAQHDDIPHASRVSHH